MNIVLTGYKGFLGKHIAKLLKDDHTFNFLGRVEDVDENVTDINDVASVSTVLKNSDVIIHTAARCHILRENSSNPWFEYYKSNVDLSIKLAKLSISLKLKRFIFISSLNVLGTLTESNKKMVYDSFDPSCIFSNSKMIAEIELIDLFKNSSTQLVIIRPPLVYGEGVKANFVALFNLITKKLPLPFGAITKNRRSLVSVYNLVDLIETCIHHPNAANQTFLVSDDHDLSTTEMVKLMAKVHGVKPWLLPVPVWMLKLLGKITGKSDMISRLTDSLQVDITHTKETLDWTPPYSVEEGFAKCVQTPRNKKTS